MARKSLLGWVKTLVLAGALAAGTNAASAQYQYCVEHGDLVAHLTENFQERQFAFGLIGQVAIMEVLSPRPEAGRSSSPMSPAEAASSRPANIGKTW